jgi:exoenzyme U
VSDTRTKATTQYQGLVGLLQWGTTHLPRVSWAKVTPLAVAPQLSGPAALESCGDTFQARFEALVRRKNQLCPDDSIANSLARLAGTKVAAAALPTATEQDRRVCEGPLQAFSKRLDNVAANVASLIPPPPPVVEDVPPPPPSMHADIVPPPVVTNYTPPRVYQTPNMRFEMNAPPEAGNIPPPPPPINSDIRPPPAVFPSQGALFMERFQQLERRKNEFCSVDGIRQTFVAGNINALYEDAREKVGAAYSLSAKQEDRDACDGALVALENLLNAVSAGADSASRAKKDSAANLVSSPRSENHASIKPDTKISFASTQDRSFDIIVASDGKVEMSAPPPPVREITFSGGGGKGAALPGAVAALIESNVLKDAKVLNGASVGSMTAALVAAGITAKDFTRISNDPKTGAAISQGRGAAGLLMKGAILKNPLSGEGLESLMRREIGLSIVKHIQTFKKTQRPDNQTAKTLEQIKTKATLCQIGLQGGVTFGDLQTLSSIIPDIKELNIAGTFMSGTFKAGDNSNRTIEQKGRPQLFIFNADTTPDLDIAVAVHASAALPPVFGTVDIDLPSGVAARFEDGGVMNNAPSSELVGAKRSVDPMPTSGKMTFVFEGEDDVIQKGPAVLLPTRKPMNDFFSGAPNSAAEYAKKRGLAEHPEDVVTVPLKVRTPAPNGGQGPLKDFSTLVGGTLNMNMSVEDKVSLQRESKDATKAYLAQRKQPRTTTFESVNQMLNIVSDGDLAAMAKNGFPGAGEEVQFRSGVTSAVTQLERIAAGAKAADLQGGSVRELLDALHQLANGDQDRLGFVARELNRSGKLDPLMTLAESSGDQGLDVLQAGVTVQVGLNVQARCQFVLREVIYPKMVKQDMRGCSGALLRTAENMLRAATTTGEVDYVLDALVEHFREALEVNDWSGDSEFASELRTYKYGPRPRKSPPSLADVDIPPPPREPPPPPPVPPRNSKLNRTVPPPRPANPL